MSDEMMNGRGLPAGWRLVKLGDYCYKPDYGYTESATNKPVGPKFLRITDIQDGGVDWETVPYCECKTEVRNEYRLQAGDIVVARIGATTGKAYLIKDCPEVIFASYLIRIRAKSDVLPAFLNFFFQAGEYWAQIDQQKGGKLKGGVNIPILQNLSLPLPPLPEQRASAAALRTVQAALERECKAALMQLLFTQGMRGEPTKTTEIGELPASWEPCELRSVAQIAYGLTVNETRRKNSELAPYLTVANVTRGALRLDEVKQIGMLPGDAETYKLSCGDVLFVEGNDNPKMLGSAAVWNDELPFAMHQNHLIRARPHKERVLPEWIMCYVNSDDGRAQLLGKTKTSSGLHTINSRIVGNLQIPLPPLSEQRTIAEVLRTCDDKIVALEREAATHDELFKALLEELMTGKRRVAVAEEV